MSAVLQFPTRARSIESQIETALIGYPVHAISAAIRYAQILLQSDPTADALTSAVIWAHARYCPTPFDAA